MSAFLSRYAGSELRRAVLRTMSWEFFLAALSVPASILLNRSLEAEGRGLLTLIQLVPTTIFTLGTCQWDRLAKGYLTSGDLSGREAWRRSLYYALVLSAVFIPISVAGSFAYPAVPAGVRWMSALYSLNFPLYFLNGTLGAIFLATGSISGQYRMTVAYQGSYLVLLSILFLTGQVGVGSMLIVYVLIYVVALSLGLAMKKELLRGQVQSGRPGSAPLRKGFVPFALETLGARADEWALSLFAELAILGSYAAISALMLPMNLVSNAMVNAATAKLNWRDDAAVSRFLVKNVLALIVFAAAISVLGLAFGRPVLRFVLGESFAGAVWMIPWVAGIVLANAGAFQFHIALQLTGRERAYMFIQSAAPAVRLGLVLLCGAAFGPVGVLFGLLVNGALRAGACAYALFRPRCAP